MTLDRLFRKPASRHLAKDGSGRQIFVEHKIGKEVAAYSSDKLMEKTGLLKDWMQFVDRFGGKISDKAEKNKFVDDQLRTRRRQLSMWVRSYRHFLTRFYRVQGVLPRFAIVPVSDDARDTALYIQALVDIKTKNLVAGDVNDLAAWAEQVKVRTQAIRDLNEDAEDQAKAILRMPNINKDLAHRMKLLLKGELIMNARLGIVQE